MSETVRPISAYPTKAFFVEMLTRDISVIDCVLDLVDNAVSKAVEANDIDVSLVLTKGPGGAQAPLARISITVDQTSFMVEDSSGGISRLEAMSDVFVFGHDYVKKSKFGLSVYGIGMKRAFFKLGDSIQMHSRTATEEWALNWNVPEWEQRGNADWNLDFAEVGSLTARLSQSSLGTLILVKDLHPDVQELFNRPSFLPELKRRLSATYALFALAGVEFSVNGDMLTSALPQVQESDEIQPARVTREYDGVKCLIVVGLAPNETDTAGRGWYVFCNGRMVVESDKTSLTGWGDVLPQFHSKFRRFLGFTYFQSEDLTKLPWTTTKQGVERESKIYQHALAEMQLQGRPVTNFLGRMYPGEIPPEGVRERDSLEQARPVSIASLGSEERLFAYRPVQRAVPQDVTINYKVPKSKVDQAKKALGDSYMSSRQVGLETFDYFYARECEEA